MIAAIEDVLVALNEADVRYLVVPVISIDDLITMKNAAARPRDVDDVRALRALGAKEEPSDG